MNLGQFPGIAGKQVALKVYWPSVAPNSSRWPSLDFIPSGTMHILLMASLRTIRPRSHLFQGRNKAWACWSLIRCQDLARSPYVFFTFQTFATKVLKVAGGQGTVHLTLAMRSKSIWLEERHTLKHGPVSWTWCDLCITSILHKDATQTALAWFLDPKIFDMLVNKFASLHQI